MEDNIQKLYEIAKVPRIYSEFNNGRETVVENVFSPYRQLELVKFLGKRQDFGLSCFNSVWSAETDFHWECYVHDCQAKSFEQALAGLVVKIWKIFTKDEKQEIKRILQ